MNKILLLLISAASLTLASQNMNYPLEIPGERDPLYYSVAFVSESRGYKYIEAEHQTYEEGSSRPMTTKTRWDDRQGIKAEIISKDLTIRAAYFDSKVSDALQRFKNGTQKEDFLRKEDLAKFLEVGLSTEFYDLYAIRDFNHHGSYSLDGGETQLPYTASMVKLGIKVYNGTRFGKMGGYVELQRSRTLRLMRVGEIQEDGTVKTLRTVGPLNKTVNGAVAGFHKPANPSGRLYVTSTASVAVGVAESPVDEVTDIGMPGYYLRKEGYDLLANLDGSIIAGMNSVIGGLRLRGSVELFAKTVYAAPAANVYPDGIHENNLPVGRDIDYYRNQFTEEYTDFEVIYGVAAQVKLIF